MYEWIEIAKKLIWLIKPIQWYTTAVKSKQSASWCNCTLGLVGLEAIGSLFAQVYLYENVRSVSWKNEIDVSIWRLKKNCHFFGWLLKELVEF